MQPDLPEAHLALGFSYYYGDNNYDAALEEFEIAQRGLPNESEVYLAIGAIQRRQGKWAESTANLEKAASLNPKDVWPLQNLVFNYQMLRNFDAANKTIDRALALNPTAFGPLEIKSKLGYRRERRFQRRGESIRGAEINPHDQRAKTHAAGARADVFLLERKYREGLQEAEKPAGRSPSQSLPGALCSKYYLHRLCAKSPPGRSRSASGFSKGEERLPRSN